MAGQLVGRHDAAAVAGAEGTREAEAGRGPETVRSSLLSRAGMLLGTSLDTGRTLAAIAELLVPSFADHCVVDLLDDTGMLRRVVTVRMDHARSRRTSSPSVADRRISYPDEHPCAIALRSGRPALSKTLSKTPRPATPTAPVPRPATGGHPLLTDAAAVIAV